MTTEEKIEVIRASDEGKEIEIYDEHYEKWRRKCTNEFWDFGIYKYRVKPIPTRLDVANEFFEKTFGVKNAFDEKSCVVNSSMPCDKCVAHKEGLCKSKNGGTHLMKNRKLKKKM